MELERPLFRLPVDPSPDNWPWKIPLTKGCFALVDEQDHEVLSGFKWYSVRTGKGPPKYAARWTYSQNPNKKTKTSVLLMHRQILDAPKGLHVDHINGNGMDNRRCNIRLASCTENYRNRCVSRGTSRYKGVHWNSKSRLWTAQIGSGQTKNGVRARSMNLGNYKDEEDAAIAYDRAASKLFGEFARLNFPGLDDGRVLVRSEVRGSLGETGENARRAKFTFEQAMEIRNRSEAGESRVSLAGAFDVHVTTIARILKWECYTVPPRNLKETS